MRTAKLSGIFAIRTNSAEKMDFCHDFIPNFISNSSKCYQLVADLRNFAESFKLLSM